MMRNMKTAEPPEFYTVAEVATLMQYSPKTVRKWVAAGRVDSSRTPGGGIRFPACAACRQPALSRCACGECERAMCENCAVRLGSICGKCRDALASS